MTRMFSVSLARAGGRAGALALLALALFAIYQAALAPLIDSYARTRRSEAELDAALDRHRASARRLPALRAELAALRARGEEQAGYLSGDSATIASAGLQARVSGAVIRAGGSVRSIEILAPEPDGARSKIALRARTEIGLAGLQHLLHALEETAPRLVVDTLDIRPEAAGPLERNKEADSRLVVAFRIYGYLRSAP